MAEFEMFRLDTVGDTSRLPHTVKILLENLLRRAGSRDVTDEDVASLARWPESTPESNIAFMPARILMQDFTGVPAVVDLAAMRSAVDRTGADAGLVNPFVPVDLVIDHSVQVDMFGNDRAYAFNIEREYERNRERYSLLNWAQQAFEGFRVVPPGMGICHQVNLEHLGKVVQIRDGVAFPDTVLGTDSHTPMVNGLGILGWGVGGIEAEAAMLGQPLFLSSPTVVGVKVLGALPPGTTATDLVLTLTQMLRKHGVVGKFVEFYGSGLSTMTVADRATLSNMSPEFGATASLFPVDAEVLRYLKLTGRDPDVVERYTKEQGLFRTDDDPDPSFSESLELDLTSIVPSMAGPKRPQDRVALPEVWKSFVEAFQERLEKGPGPREVGRFLNEGGNSRPPTVDTERPIESGENTSVDVDGMLRNGSVVIAAITSCTNTSNPSVMLAAGLLAKKAVEAGLVTQPWVKTSMAPGSRVVTQYLDAAGLTTYLEKLGFNLVGYGCTTCIGNSGAELASEKITKGVEEKDLVVTAVLSGNRNFEGRIHPLVRASYLASPPLVVAFALAGSVDFDLTKDPLGQVDGSDIFLKDIWPAPEEVADAARSAVTEEQFEQEYGRIFEGDDNWRQMPAPSGQMFEWDPSSTYVKEPPFFLDLEPEVTAVSDIENARVLVKVGDSITTDHISPAGSIKAQSPAGKYLQEIGVEPRDFNSYGSRRGNHEVMLRGTFGNVRLRNELAPESEGPWTTHLPSGEQMTIYDASLRYQSEQTPLLVLAGKEYGSGSSRDWAAKGTSLLGVRAVLAESYERIHRSNLVGMGVLPLQYQAGESADTHGLTGRETFTLRGISDGISPRQELTLQVHTEDGESKELTVTSRIDMESEVDYYRNGGILQMVLRQILSRG